MLDQADKRSPILRTLALSFVAAVIAFLFACESELDTFEKKDNTYQYEFLEADLEQEIKDRLAFLENAPEDFIDFYISAQHKYPEYYYMPIVMWITENQLKTFSLEEFKNLKRFDNFKLETEYSRYLTRDETVRYYTEEEIRKLNIASSYVVIQRVDRRQYMEYTYKMNNEDVSIHDDVNKMAMFKGGMQALVKHLQENLKYPEIAKEQGIEDKVVMRFVVNKFGGLVHLNVDQEPSTSNEEVSLELQKAAFAAMRTTEGLWEPAEKNGRYVFSRMTLPIEFKLDK